MSRQKFLVFQAPDVRDNYIAKYGDPLEDVSPQDLMDLMENLWTSNRGSYATTREKMRREGHDPWTVRLKLVEEYFKALFIRQEKLDEVADKLKLDDVALFIQFRIDELIKQFQEREAEEARNTRDKFGIRSPRA